MRVRSLMFGLCLALHARAQDESLPPPPRPETALAASRDELRTVTARVPVEPAQDDAVRFVVHGELQLRAEALSDLRLRRSDDTFDRLGQEERLYYWLRLTPRLHVGERLELVGQADLPQGMLAGQEPRGVRTHEEIYAERRALDADPRWLFVEYRVPTLTLRLGLQPSHHGLGLVENDGDHAPLFGDYHGGDRYERVQAVFAPENSKLALLAAADLVFVDEAADLRDGDVAVRGSLGMRYGDEHGNVSVLGIVRHQEHDSDEGTRKRELNSVIIDSAGGFHSRVRGTSAQVFGEYELAFRFGDESFGRTLTGPVVDDDAVSVSGWGAVARVGAAWANGSRPRSFGRFVFMLEWGHASGDAKPQNLREEGFALDPNHRVGLLLFDHVLRWKSARAKAIVGSSPRAADIATRGAVAGASYVSPTLVYRPLRQLDLRTGVVVAQASEDFVDPMSVLVTGTPTNYDGGTAAARDLGIELDAGVEWRVGLHRALDLELGAQAGVLFPGHAFDSASGDALDLQHLTMARVGVQY